MIKNKVKVLATIAIGLLALNIENVYAADTKSATAYLNLDHNSTGITYSKKETTSINVCNCQVNTDEKTGKTTTNCDVGVAPCTSYSVKNSANVCDADGNCENRVGIGVGTGTESYKSIDDFKKSIGCNPANPASFNCKEITGYVPYYDNKFTVNIDGKNEEGYCLDAGFAMSSGGVAMSCSKIDDPRYAKAMKYVMNKDVDHVVKQLALRFIAYDAGYSKSTDTTTSWKNKAIKNYWDGSTGDTLIGGSAATAKTLAKEALNYAKEHSGSADSQENGIRLTIIESIDYDKEGKNGKSSEGYIVKYRVETTQEVPLNVKFSCSGSGCKIKEGENFNGTSGELTILIPALPEGEKRNECGYTIKASYDDLDKNTKGDLYVCDAGAQSKYQQIAVNLHSAAVVPGDDDDSEGGDKTTQKITGKVPAGSNYYNNFCDEGIPTPPNNCTANNGGKTKIEIPTYCDAPNAIKGVTGETNIMKITGPTNVESCVLKSADEAGNTYQDTTVVKESNPYCAVYCKEDYEMTLPTAQYALTGKWFELKSTTVKGTRTCYVTSANDTDKTGINFEKFVTDVINAQRALVDAYNSYKEEEALQKSGGAKTGYTHYTITDCNNSTGSCTISSKNMEVQSVVGITVESLEAKKARLNEAKNNLNSITGSINDCYHWENNFCFDPKAIFDYDEEYTDDINYQKVEETAEDEITTSGRNINSEYEISDQESVTTKISYIGCTGENCDNLDQNENAKTVSSTAIYMKKERTKTAEFQNIARFTVKQPTGAVKRMSQADANKCIEEGKCLKDYSYLGAVFPIALEHPQGIYNWSIDFKRIGQMNLLTSDNCLAEDTPSDKSMGRLNAVADAIFKDLPAQYQKGLSSDIKYQCVYALDIDSCDGPPCQFTCVCPDAPTEPIPDGSSWTCKVVEDNETGGVTCIQKVTDPPNPPDCPQCEVYCENCIFNGTDTYSYRTISLDKINPNDRTMGSNWTSEKGQKAIDEIQNNGQEAYKKPEYSFTISPTQMKAIRDYNNSQGTYIAKNVTYESLNGYIGATNKSSFIRDNTDTYFSNDPNKYKLNNEWTLWPDFIPESVDQNSSIGPAWK